jgi:transcriptional regulator with PAS, ATPase and Fis domain
MRHVLELVERVAKSEATVLITGESGAGKECVARLIHEQSTRSAGPFVAINCGAISETLLESELFGHVRGAFTGAIHDRPGLFEAANHGTLLLDEIGVVPSGMQVKLLRVLQEHEVRRVGSNKDTPVDVRVIGATNRDLPQRIAANQFRQDLYYRLKVLNIHVPPLRERHEDILQLAERTISEVVGRTKSEAVDLSPEVTERLLGYDWPGNVRELENVIEHAVVMAAGRRIDMRDLPDDVWQAAIPIATPQPNGKVRPLAEITREYIESALAENEGNQSITARELGIGSATLYRKLKAYGLLRTRNAKFARDGVH